MRLSSFASQKRYGALVLAGVILTTPFAHGRAAEGSTFLIPKSDQDGYGIGECLHEGSPCGRVIADAWCEAHGHAHAIAFGSASDVTGALPGVQQIATTSAEDVLIRCGE